MATLTRADRKPLEQLAATWQQQRWWLTRIAVLPLHLLTFAVIAFFLVRAVPGDPVLTILGETEWSQEDYDRIEAALGLSGGVFEQLGRYLGQLVRLDLGRSMYSGRAVSTELAQRVPETVELALMGLIGSMVFSFVCAWVVSVRPRTIAARGLRIYARMAGAVPQFILAVFSIYLFYFVLRWVPAPIGRTDPRLPSPDRVTGLPLLDSMLGGEWAVTSSMIARLILPVMVMVISQSDVLLKILISSLDEEIESPQTMFRAAVGAPQRLVLLSAYRRALPPMVTMTGVVFGNLLGGAVILEALFGLGALGGYAVESVNTKDIVSLQGFLIVAAAISLMVYLAVDLLNMWLDPRRRPGVRVGED